VGLLRRLQAPRGAHLPGLRCRQAAGEARAHGVRPGL